MYEKDFVVYVSHIDLLLRKVVSAAVQMDAPRAVKEEDTAAVTERAEHQRWPSRQTS